MPLTLDCYCPGDSSILVCQLVGIRFIATLYSEAGSATLMFRPDVGLLGPGLTTGGGGTVSLDQTVSGLDLQDWIDAWGTARITLFAQSTGPDDLRTVATWRMILHYECVDSEAQVTHVYVNAFPRESDTQTCVDGSSVDIIGNAGGAGGAIYIARSSVLGCTDITLSVGDFFPEIEPPLIGEGGGTPTHCLCPSGGSGNYLFSLVGELPDGMTLNPETGCVEGSPTGTPGGATITYRVVDLDTGDTAEVTCAYVPGCACLGAGNSFY
jgi:hypothetical protein